MASVKEVVEGLEILAKTAKVPAGLAEKGETDTRTAHLRGAGHGIIFGPDANPCPEDKTRLVELGWKYSEDDEGWIRFL